MHFTFVPHLLPIDQGLLASCYATPAEPLDARGVRELYARPTRTSRSSSCSTTPPRTRDVRDTNRATVHVDGGRRPRARVLRDRQPLEGRRRPGGAGPQPDARPAGDGGARVSARPSSARAGSRRRRTCASSSRTRSRRASAPPAWPPGSSPRGSTSACSSRTQPDTVSAARFTTNARVGAPVIVSRQAELDRLRAVAANSGGSNVGDGQRGLETARRDAGGRRRASSASSPARWAWPPPA